MRMNKAMQLFTNRERNVKMKTGERKCKEKDLESTEGWDISDIVREFIAFSPDLSCLVGS